MPAKTEKQRRFMGAELERKREGKKTRTGMSEAEAIVSAREQELMAQRESEPVVSAVYWDRQQPTDTSY